MNQPAAKFSAAEILAVTGGTVINNVELDGVFSVATDNRADCSGAVFIAIKGEFFDPHDNLGKATANNAAALLIEKRAAERVDKSWRIPVIAVDSTLHAYWALAKFHRLRFKDLKVAALTGSVGKTSVKEMTRAICAAACADPEIEVLATVGNTNNHFGVPANLLRLTPRHRYAVIELGTSSPGEIAPLAAMTAPNAAAVNTIAACHLEKLGSLDGVAEEKGSIFSALPPDGTAVFPARCHGTAILRKHAGNLKTLRFGENGDVTGRYLGGSLAGSSIELIWRDGEKCHIDWSLSGPHQAANAGCAAALAAALGIDRPTIARGLAAAALPGMRMLVREFNGTSWVIDAYNANPESMAAALDWLGEFTPPEKFLAVLGDMRELGGFELEGHLNVLKKMTEKFPHSAAVLVGDHMAEAAAQLPPELKTTWRIFKTAEDAQTTVAEMAKPGFTVLIKASRGTALEKTLPAEVAK